MDKSVKDTLKSPAIMGGIIVIGLSLIVCAIFTWVKQNSTMTILGGIYLFVLGWIFMVGFFSIGAENDFKDSTLTSLSSSSL
jgi:uncharacterized membrane protein